jgi:hypothetical protein
MQAQLEQQKQSMDAEFKAQELYLKQTIETSKQYLAQQELEIKNNALYIEQMKVVNAADANQTKNEMTAENNRVKAMLDLQRLELERVATKLSETEKLLEERRLTFQQELERVRMGMENMSRNASPIMVQMDYIQKKRKATIINDTQGNPIGIDIQDIIE